MAKKPDVDRTIPSREKRKARYESAVERVKEQGGGAMIPDHGVRGGLPLRSNVEPWTRRREAHEWDCPECGHHNAKHWSTCQECNERRPVEFLT